MNDPDTGLITSLISCIISLAILITFFVMAYRLKVLITLNTPQPNGPTSEKRKQWIIDLFIQGRVNELAGNTQEAIKHYLLCYYNFLRSAHTSFEYFGEALSAIKVRKKIEELAGKPLVSERKDFTL